MLGPIIKEGFVVIAFDFAGTGNSEGDKITLGYNEYQDIEAVMVKAKEFQFVDSKRIALWGRSMGAVSCIRYAALHAESDDV